MASTTYAQQWLKQAVFANEFNFFSLKSRTRHHFVYVNKMYAIHERFRGLTKTCHLGNVNKLVTFCHQFAVLGNMVRNAGQLPQPFWLGAACGGGSCSAAPCTART